ncbi:MAG: DUF3298 and DUF4163 domain-containing protein [Clostridiales bacterium]|nr:DUF3298 and DUF4163 domain-containing protein [Clostridiales bacterium]
MKKTIVFILIATQLILAAGCSLSQAGKPEAQDGNAGAQTSAVDSSEVQSAVTGTDQTMPNEVNNAGTAESSSANDVQSSGSSGQPVEIPARVSVAVPEDEVLNEIAIKGKNGITMVTVKADLPTIRISDNKTAADRINAAISKNVTDFRQNAGSFVSEAEDIYKTRPETDTSEWFGYSFDLGISPERVDTSVISLHYYDWSYTLGAHGNTLSYAENYDTASGSLLTLADISSDKQALLELASKRLPEIAAGNENAEGYFEGWQKELAKLLDESVWYFSDKGLSVICNTYLIGPYALGMLDFTIPYTELHGILLDKYFPADFRGASADNTSVKLTIEPYTMTEEGAEAGAAAGGEAGTAGVETGAAADEAGSGGLDVISMDSMSPDSGSTDSASTDSSSSDVNAEKFRIKASSTVYNVKLSSVVYTDQDNSFYVKDIIYYTNRLTKNDSLVIQALIPESAPNLKISYTLPNGTVEERYISQSGMDGSLLLISQ